MRGGAPSLCFLLSALAVIAGCNVSGGALKQRTHAANTVALPFVACRSDGQQGPAQPPARPAVIPQYPADIAARLAYYVSDYSEIVAPRGWYCLGLLGSSGSGLIISPKPVVLKDLLTAKDAGFYGPIVMASHNFSGTLGGRFEVANVAARVFPVARKYVDSVLHDWPNLRGTIKFIPYPGDEIRRLSDTKIEFQTHPNQEGLGTAGSLVMTNAQPVDGAALLDEEFDLLMIKVRLPEADRDLTRMVLQAFESSALDYPVPRSKQR
jgi:hypothetical protein